MSVSLNSRSFFRRLSILTREWKEKRECSEWGGSDALLLIAGTSDESASYQTVNAFQIWLLGYEFLDTIICLTSKELIIYTSEKKSRYLVPLTNNEQQPVRIVKRTKNPLDNKKLICELADAITKSYSGRNVGVLTKDKNYGPVVEEWKTCSESERYSFTQIDVTTGLSSIIAIKDEDEKYIAAQASELCDSILSNFLLPEILRHIDEEIPITHMKLSTACDNLLAEPNNKLKRWKLPKDKKIDFNLVDWVYQPTIQSGGKYDLRIAVPSDNELLREGAIICSLAIRYKAYCAQLSRTYFINPAKEQEKDYTFLIKLQQYALSLLVDGAKCSQVYLSTIEYIEKSRPDLKQYFMKNMGWSIGVEFREYLVLSAKCHHIIKTGMIFALVLGFYNIKLSEQVENNPTGLYSLLLGDTVVVNKGDPATPLTKLNKNPEVITYIFDDKADRFKHSSSPNSESGRRPHDTMARLRSSRKKRATIYVKEFKKGREENQKRLHKALQDDGYNRFKNSKSTSRGNEDEELKRFESYKKEFQLPEKVKDCPIVIDKRNETVVFSINGQPVPFHMFIIKSASLTDEQNYSYLRVSLALPAKGKREQAVPTEYADHTFIKSLTIKSSNIEYLAHICREINEFKKSITKREIELKEKADLVEQANLIEAKGRLISLPNVFVRPQVDKRAYGTVELHTNGLRYVHSSKQVPNIDILYNNIKHLFFQKCDSELIVLIHIHFNYPIIIGKRKTSDIQFYREVSDNLYDETTSRHNRRMNHDYEDEIEMEKEERKHRAVMNEQLLKFAEAIQEASGVDVEIPNRSEGFHGISGRQMLLYQPTNNCLVHLTEQPFLIIIISEVELVHLERVQFGLKNFDMVFVYKDYTRPVTHINSILVNKLEFVKEWLDKVDIPFSEGPANLSWPDIMAIINNDPCSFFETGGWSFLLPLDDEEGGKSDESESDFEPDSEELEEEESSSDYSSEEESSVEGPAEEDEDDESYEDDESD